MDREFELRNLLVSYYADEDEAGKAAFEAYLSEYMHLTRQTRDEAIADVDEYREGILRDMRDAEAADEKEAGDQGG